MSESSRKVGRNAAVIGVLLLASGFCCVGGLGVTSAIAIPQFIGYIRRSKVAEAHYSLATLRSLVEIRCADTGALPPPTGPEPPTPRSDRQGFRGTTGFSDLGFSPADPVYYSYAIEPSPGGIRVVARGDIDGDGVLSELWFTCSASPCACDPDVSVRDELE